MATGTKGPDRAKPEWGKPPPGPTAAPAKGNGKGKGKPAARGKPAAKGKGAARPTGRSAAKGKTKTNAKGPARRKAPRRQSSLRKRYGIVHDTNGPRVRLGFLWFIVAFTSIAAGPMATAFVYGSAAAVAAAQTARVWRRGTPQPSDVMAAGGAALIAGGACFGAGGAGLGMLGAVVLAFAGAAGDSRSRNPRIADIGWTLQCALVPGVVAMSMVLLTRLDQGSAISLLLLVSVYETGDYLIGSGSTNPFEGPAAGVAAIVVITFIVSTLPISALSFGEAWLFGGLVAVLAPAGQLLASGLLPEATAPASALRRLDSLLLTAPVWAWGVGLVL
jgi:hypothetical protein